MIAHCVLGRVGCAHGMASIVEQQTPQQCRRPVPCCRAMRPLLCQLGLNRIKELALHERGLRSRTDLSFVSNLSHVKAVTQQVEQRTLRERNAAARAAIGQLTNLRPEITLAKVDHEPVHASQLQVSPEYRSNLFGLLLNNQKLAIL